MVSQVFINRITDTEDISSLRKEMRSIINILHHEDEENEKMELIRKLNIIIDRIIELHNN